MCYFITIGVPAKLVSALEEFHREYKLTPHGNASIRKAFGAEHKPFTITSGGCSCSLYSQPGEQQGKQEARLRAKYKKKGWSQAKIDRAMANKSHATQYKFNGLHPDLRQHLSQVISTLKHLYMFVHWYSDNVDIESINIVTKKAISVSDLLNNAPVPQDTLIQMKV
jgi:hypothetical protein